VEGAHSVVQNLLDVHLVMSFSRSLVFGNQLDVAKSLLLNVGGPNLSVDEEGRKHWNSWRAQEITNVVMVDKRLAKVLEPTDISYYELQECIEIEWGEIFSNGPSTAQGDLLVVFQARESTMDFEKIATWDEWHVDDLNKAIKLAKKVLHAHGYSSDGDLDTDVPFPVKKATQTIVDLLAARVKVLPRCRRYWNAWKDYGFLLQLAVENRFGLGSQQWEFQKQVEKNLKKCSHRELLGLSKEKDFPTTQKDIKKLINQRKKKYHDDQNNGSAWCKYVCHRLDAIIEADEESE